MDKIIKSFIGKSTVNEDGTVKSVISTNDIDRYDEIVNPKGARLDNYRRNPVVLFNHNSNIPPVGKNINIAVYDNEIVALTKFADTQLGRDMKSLYADGFMNAFSIGFIPNKTDIDENGRRVFNDWELLEYSCVPIPANPNAIAMALKSIQSPELKTILNEYNEMQNNDTKIKELEDKIEEMKAQVEMLALSYDNIFNSAEFVDGYQNEVQNLTNSYANIEKEVAKLSEVVNNKVKSYDNQLTQTFIEEKVAEKLNKFFKNIK